MSDRARGSYEFGPFHLDPEGRMLRGNGGPVALTPKCFDTLCALVENAGRVMTKEDLMKRVWPDTFVGEATLAQSISVLRKGLGDSADVPRYIETIPKHGYRFVAAVSLVEAPPPGRAVVPPRVQLVTRRGPHASWKWAGAGALLLTVLLGGWAYLRRPPPSMQVAAPASKVMLAVLPFTNLSGDPGEEYLSDGLTEELITELGSLHPDRVGVIARTSAMHYKNTHEGIADIGRELGVGYILEGSVRVEGRRVRVSAQLIQVRDQTHVWADSYERDLSQILTMQLQVARTVAEQIQARLFLPPAPLRGRRGTANVQAYELYLKAHYFLVKRTPETTQKAVALYQQAIGLDPTYALAYAELSRCFAPVGPGETVRQVYARAEALARKAIELDDSLGEAHGALAAVALHDFDWATAGREFRRAEELNPLDRDVEFLIASGRFGEAAAESERVRERDPVNMLARHGQGLTYFYGRQYDLAIHEYLQAIELEPQTLWSKIRLAQAYAQVGRYQAAIDALDGLKNGAALLEQAQVWALSGRRQEAMDVLTGAVAASQGPNKEAAFDIALIYAALGQKDAALKWLNIAYDARVYQVIYLRVDPRLDALRGDPRYADLVRRIGFPS